MSATILIIGDYDDDAKLLELSLRRLGISNPIQIVHDALGGVAYIEGTSPYSDRTVYPLPKIIFLDLKMPGMDSFDFLTWLNTSGNLEHFSVFAISGLEDVSSIRRAYQVGATSFVIKPFSDADLLNLIKKYPSHWTFER